MTKGQVIDNTASSGGTSYYNSSVVNYKGLASNSCNGSFKLTPVSIGFDSNTSLDGALATDLAAPDKPAAEIKNVDRTGTTGKATISISKPEDHGTTYKFQVEAFSVANASASLGGKTNMVPETVTLTTGVKGYRIGVFDARHTGISCKDGIFYENGSKITAGPQLIKY